MSMQKTFFQPNFALNAFIVILIMSRWVIVYFGSEKNIMSRWVALLDLDELIIPSKAAWENHQIPSNAGENQVRTTF